MMSEQGITTRYDLLDRGLREDPYPFYRQLREEDPIHFSESWGGWLLTRYDDVASALKDARLSLGGGVAAMFDRLPAGAQAELLPLRRHTSMWLGSLEHADHARLRSLMSRAFTPRLIEGMRTFIQRVTNELLDQVQGAGRMDVIRDLAYPLPSITIATLLGTPTEDHGRFEKWSGVLTEFLGHGTLDVGVLRRAQDTVLEMTDYLGHLARGRCQEHRRNDLLGNFIAAEKQGCILNEEEMLANCVLLLFAGHETTSILIGNSILALLRNPDQLRKLKARPDLIDNAVEEFLRYDSPVQMVRRSASQDLVLGGKQIKAGQLVWLVLGAANRDPARFSDPDRLDIERREDRHLAFGFGVHYCLGATLSAIEGQVAVSTLLTRMPTMRPETSKLEWLDNPTTHALKSLPIYF